MSSIVKTAVGVAAGILLAIGVCVVGVIVVIGLVAAEGRRAEIEAFKVKEKAAWYNQITVDDRLAEGSRFVRTPNGWGSTVVLKYCHPTTSPVVILLHLSYSSKDPNPATKPYYVSVRSEIYSPNGWGKVDVYRGLDWPTKSKAVSWFGHGETYPGLQSDLPLSAVRRSMVPERFVLFTFEEPLVETGDLYAIASDDSAKGSLQSVCVEIEPAERAQLRDFLSRAAWYNR